MHEHFDADGNPAGTTVITREPEWDDDARGRALRLAAEARAEPVEEQAQSPQQCPCGPRRHTRSV